MPPKKFPLVVVLDNIRSLYNVGAIFRTCDGAGVERLYLTGITGYPTQSKRAQRQIEKTALGTIESVNWEYRTDTMELLKELKTLPPSLRLRRASKTLKLLKSQGYQIIALEKTENSINYQDSSSKYKWPIALVVGHETLGVSDEILEMADLVVHIPMHGRAKSLNVATAVGVMVYHLTSIYKSSR